MDRKMAANLNETLKFILMLTLCCSTVCTPIDADPSISRTDLNWRLCSLFRFSRFCLPYILGSYNYNYPLLPVPFPGAVLPIAPFPLIVNPTQSAASFTIPTVLTTSRPGLPPGGQTNQPGPIGPIQPFPPFPSGPIPNPSGPCPPIISVCPPAAAAAPIVPSIDPRQSMFT